MIEQTNSLAEFNALLAISQPFNAYCLIVLLRLVECAMHAVKLVEYIVAVCA